MENKIYQYKTVYDLNDTVDLMLSKDYKERFVGEYLQLKIRYEKLKKFNLTFVYTQVQKCDTVILDEAEASVEGSQKKYTEPWKLQVVYRW